MSTLKTAVNGIPMSAADNYSIHKTNPGEIDIPNRVFVKGFPREASEEDLKTYFEEYGIVHESKIVKDKTGISKGYAFITFDSQDVAEKVKLLGNVDFNGKEVVLGPARVRKKRTPLFKSRPDQLWQNVVPGMQQPVYYSVSQDGVWYFQPPVQQVLSVVPSNQVQSYGGQANCWPSTQYQMQGYPQQNQMPYAPNPVSTPVVSAAYQVGELLFILPLSLLEVSLQFIFNFTYLFNFKQSVFFRCLSSKYFASFCGHEIASEAKQWLPVPFPFRRVFSLNTSVPG